MADRWVNFHIDLTMVSEVAVDATNAEKMDALDKVVDDLIDVLETSGFYHRHDLVMSGRHEDVEEGATR